METWTVVLRFIGNITLINYIAELSLTWKVTNTISIISLNINDKLPRVKEAEVQCNRLELLSTSPKHWQNFF
jgi:hypothetical protein